HRFGCLPFWSAVARHRFGCLPFWSAVARHRFGCLAFWSALARHRFGCLTVPVSAPGPSSINPNIQSGVAPPHSKASTALQKSRRLATISASVRRHPPRWSAMTDDELRNRLTERIQQLSPERLVALEQLLARVEPAASPAPSVPAHAQTRRPVSAIRDWPRAPLHRLSEHGTYLVTAGTLYKDHHFASRQRLDLLQAKLLELARKYGWRLEAWAVFSNH